MTGKERELHILKTAEKRCLFYINQAEIVFNYYVKELEEVSKKIKDHQEHLTNPDENDSDNGTKPVTDKNTEHKEDKNDYEEEL